MAHRTQDVLRLIAGTLTVDEVATRHGVTAAQVERWRDDYLWAVDQLASQRAPRRRFTVLAVVASVALAGVLGFSSDAWAQSCGATLPYGVTAFCPNSPAVATQVNNNFGRVVQLLEQKVGTANTTSVAMTGPVTSTGAVTVSNTVSANTFSTIATPMSSTLLSSLCAAAVVPPKPRTTVRVLLEMAVTRMLSESTLMTEPTWK